jgi:hypothetical protein
VYGYGTGKRHSFNFGQQTTVFQSEVNAIIKACANENINRGYKIGTFRYCQRDRS